MVVPRTPALRVRESWNHRMRKRREANAVTSASRVRRPTGRGRGRATPATRTALAAVSFPAEPDLPVCERHDPTGEPGALNRHVGFGERGVEPWQGERMRHPHEAKAAGKRLLPHAKAGASLPDSTQWVENEPLNRV